MTVLTPQIVAEVMRQRMKDPDGSDQARYINGIPEALKNTARKVAANPRLRPLLLTDRLTTTSALSSGKVTLSDLYNTHHILLEYLQKGRIYHSNNTYPLREVVPALAAQTQPYSDYYYFYIDGPYLYAFQANKSALTGTLSFAVPKFPTTLAGLGDSEEIQTIFFDKLYEWSLSHVAAQNDAAEDGDK